MSDYCKAKVLRIPVTPEQLRLKDDWQCDFEEAFPDITGWFESGKFMVSCTKDLFLDYVIFHEYSCGYGDYGKVRNLFESEKFRFKPIFQQILPNVDMNKVKVVEFCWYNATEAPSYYDLMIDDFYSKEVTI